MSDDTPQQDTPSDPTATPPETPISEPPASPEVASDTETPELSPDLEPQQQPVSEPTEPILGVPASEPRGGASEQPSPVQTSQVWPSGFVGLLAKARAAIFSRKQKKLEKILNFALRQKAQGKLITNDDVEKLLRVSDKTAERYLAELVGQGKLRKTGSTSQTQYEMAI